ncbi:hypothetical protein QBZ16_001701 [Prototheca wickerhamii]|uniref:4-hydroxy-3-methylbut-2-en-1-yl diphosphate synthase (ferredoxin), chloroplastic n=1 Tax=Prototheca wickerhamii TaxID=3111 RepID=A0AAD9ID59_PROWI|nr:hypothetical protein QBZ16_001701 [Prototheca wickerhamii]
MSGVMLRWSTRIGLAGHAVAHAHRAPTAAAQASATPSSENNDLWLPTPHYCEDVYRTVRRPTRTVQIGRVPVGSAHPIARQTMTTSDTRDVAKTVEQVKRCADAGADIVRITVQGKREAEACMRIREQLFADGYDTPLVADIHFQPAVAMRVADAFEKIRINPGNFVDGRKSFEERERMREAFRPLVDKCRSLGRALRIGTNHGSLSARILSYYGDTPRGMVESAFEFAEFCREADFHNFLFSMKASNPLVMVQAYRLLAEEMYAKGWDYPLHLGVTEAGEGEDGRMKSAIGVGALLADGLGDTIRVSLTEDPWYEIVPCAKLAAIGEDMRGRGLEAERASANLQEHRDTHLFRRRVGALPTQRPGDALDYRSVLHRDGSVFATLRAEHLAGDARACDATLRALGCKMAVGMPLKDIATADSVVIDGELPSGATALRALRRLQQAGVHVLAEAAAIERAGEAALPGAVAILDVDEVAKKASSSSSVALPAGAERLAVRVRGTESREALVAALQLGNPVLAFLDIDAFLSRVHVCRWVFEVLRSENIDVPIVHVLRAAQGTGREDLSLRAGVEVGGLMVDGLGDGVMLDCPGEDLAYLRESAFGLLQGVRMRNTKTEYVSCPSCGRTLFDLQDVTDQIRKRTGHLPGVAIAVMGCIVNGPGEMADADFGYVGGAPGKIDLYVGKEVVRRGVPMDSACDQLVDLIKEHGRWKEAEPEEAEEGVLAGAA